MPLGPGIASDGAMPATGAANQIAQWRLAGMFS